MRPTQATENDARRPPFQGLGPLRAGNNACRLRKTASPFTPPPTPPRQGEGRSGPNIRRRICFLEKAHSTPTRAKFPSPLRGGVRGGGYAPGAISAGATDASPVARVAKSIPGIRQAPHPPPTPPRRGEKWQRVFALYSPPLAGRVRGGGAMRRQNVAPWHRCAPQNAVRCAPRSHACQQNDAIQP